MQALRRTVAVLIFPAIAYLGAACERETPTEAPKRAFQVSTDPPTTRWVNAVDATPPPFVPPGTSCLDPGYPTIQSAVNAANAGDIIRVCAGTYPEIGGPLTITKTLTLLGDQNNGVDARGPRGPESIIADAQGTSVGASNVVIDGFTVQNSIATAFTGFGIWLNPGISGTQILNNIIQDNIVGIGLANSGAQALIRHNLIQNNNVPGPAFGQGIYTDEFVGGPTVNNVLVEENAFKGHVIAGIDVSNTDPAGGVFNLNVSTNSFDMNGRAFILFNTHMSSIHDNSITNSTSTGFPFPPGTAAIRLLDNNSDLSILNNNVRFGVANGIRLTFTGTVGGPSSNVVIHENNIEFFPAGDGLLVDAGSHVGTVNAECNWWNSSTGPMNPSNPGGTGEKVEGNADFTPWLVAPAPGGVCTGGVPSGKVTGGGQVPASGGKATFGFNAKNQAGVGSSGHLNYLNHVTGAHLDCTVNAVTSLTTTSADFSGPCSSKSSASSFMAHVEDNNDPAPGKDNDKFTITYGTVIVPEGGTLTSGSIEIHKN